MLDSWTFSNNIFYDNEIVLKGTECNRAQCYKRQQAKVLSIL